MPYPNQLKERIVDLDFSLMVQELTLEYTSQQIADLIGAKKSEIDQAKNERIPPAWRQGIKLADMYLRVTHKETLPFI